MPNDELAYDASKPGSSPNEDDAAFQRAARRLAHEAQSMSFGTRHVRNITEEFGTAAKQLPPGQLIKDEYFTLFEAVGALEIMDPKMDSGCVLPNDTFEPNFDVCKSLDSAEVIWIMDQLLCLEIAWHDGNPLSQTIFTSLHIDRLVSPDNKPPYTFSYGPDRVPYVNVKEQLVFGVLRAYCIGLIKCCQLVLHLIQSQHFYEEEDFVTHLFGRELLPKLSSNESLKLLDNALELVGTIGLSSEIQEALEQRLLFRRTYLATLVDDLNHWPYILRILDSIHRTRYLGKPLPEAFSEKVQRRLATSTPPRPMLQLSWDKAYKKWTDMCENIIAADQLTSLWVCQSPNCLQRATWAFAYRESQPNTFSRAYFQNILFGNERLAENFSHFDLLLSDIRDLVLAGDALADQESFQVEVTTDLRHRCSRHIEAFMDKAFDEYLNLYRMVCQNRCRIRRTFTQAIPILDGMEAEARRTDEELHKLAPTISVDAWTPVSARLQPLSSWVKFHKLRLMAWTAQLGFETDIYLPDELSATYWLLSCLARNRCALLAHIEHFLLERMSGLTRSTNARYTAQCLESQDWLRSLDLSSNATRLMALALWRFCAMLMAVDVIEAPRREYAQEQLLYDARMKPYLGVVSDPVPSLEDLQHALRNFKSVESTCKSIDLDIKEAKACLAGLKKMTPQQGKYVGTEEQWGKEIKQLETTCVAIAVQASQLKRLSDKHGKNETRSLRGLVETSIPPPGKRYHEWWVVPQVKEKS